MSAKPIGNEALLAATLANRALLTRLLAIVAQSEYREDAPAFISRLAENAASAIEKSSERDGSSYVTPSVAKQAATTVRAIARNAAETLNAH